MAYNIGQYKSTQHGSDSYLIDFPHTTGYYENPDGIVNDMTFYDKAIVAQGDSFTPVLSYYLRFSVLKREDSEQIFSLYMRNTNNTNLEYQVIRNLYCGVKNPVTEGDGAREYYEVIFTPNSDYNQLCFVYHRNRIDYSEDMQEGPLGGRLIDVEVEKMAVMSNVIEMIGGQLSSPIDRLYKIGVQGPTGTLMVINGEEIRIGRTELYELYSDEIEVTYIGFVVQDEKITLSNKDANGKITTYEENVTAPFFIMDYRY